MQLCTHFLFKITYYSLTHLTLRGVVIEGLLSIMDYDAAKFRYDAVLGP